MHHTLIEMNEALGEFLTEMGRVEFDMLRFVNLISEAPIEYLFDEISGKPFSYKIGRFKAWCELANLPGKRKALVEEVSQALEILLPKRNYLIHGETLEGAFEGRSRRYYRVGIDKGNLEYLDEFDRGEHGVNIFTAEQVRAVTKSTKEIRVNLDILRAEIRKGDVSSQAEII